MMNPLTRLTSRSLPAGSPSHENADGDEPLVRALPATECGLGADTVSEDAAGDVDARVLDPDPEPEGSRTAPHRHGRERIARATVYLLLPMVLMAMTMAVGYVKWWDATAQESKDAGTESVRAASDAAIAMLSYRPDTVDGLAAAADKLTGSLKDSYTALTHDVVIPGSKQKQIAAVATVPAAASVSASPQHAITLVFVNQTVTIGNEPPTNTSSRVRVTLDKVENRWLVAAFDPI